MIQTGKQICHISTCQRPQCAASGACYVATIEAELTKAQVERDEATDLALERAAKVCEDEMVDGSVSHEDQVYNLGITHAMDSIRALKSK